MIQSIDYATIAAPLILALTAGIVLLLDAFLPAPPAARLERGRTPVTAAAPAAASVGAAETARARNAGGATPIEDADGAAAPAEGASRAAPQTGTAGGATRSPGTGRTLLGLVTLAGVVAALGVVVAQAAAGTPRGTFCVPEGLAAGTPPCSFVIDPFSLVIAGLVLAAGVVVVLLSMTELATGRIPVGEWYFLLLCTLVGAVALPASRDLVMLVVALELVSLPVFALTALKRYDGRASEAALKLFLISVVSTAVTLFGVSLLYGVTGTVYLDRLVIPEDAPPVAAAAIALLLAGFAFKVAAVPFHSWAGDVYQGAPVPVAALLSVVSKASGFAGLILLLVVALPESTGLWSAPVAVLAALTMTVGNLLALRQRHAVRLLAWSSVAQSGYILAPLGVAGGAGAALGADPGVANAAIAYLLFYAAMNLGAFSVVMLVSRRGGRNELDDYRGLAFRDAPAALALGFCLICLAGLPPGLAGMFAKIVVFRELVDGGGAVLALVMAVNTVIGLYYYIAWTARLFTPAERTAADPSGASTAGTVGRADAGATGSGARRALPVTLAVVAAVAVAVVFSVAPQAVFALLPAWPPSG